MRAESFCAAARLGTYCSTHQERAMQSTLELLKSSDPDIYEAMLAEEARERDGLELIPSENYAFPEIYATNGSVFANKYAEDRKSTRLNSSHSQISYAVFCLKK